MEAPTEHILSRANKAFKNKNYFDARRDYEVAIQDGFPEASVQLGWLWEEGLGGQRDIERAAFLYQQAIDKGEVVLGSYHLASLLMKQGSSERASELFRAAAGGGHASAAYWLYIIELDRGDASVWRSLEVAAVLGHEYARRDLARQRMRKANSLFTWLGGFGSYVMAKVRGLLIILSNPHDPRVR
jgi:TPR repeat protein